jgi:hypothetical protein
VFGELALDANGAELFGGAGAGAIHGRLKFTSNGQIDYHS